MFRATWLNSQDLHTEMFIVDVFQGVPVEQAAEMFPYICFSEVPDVSDLDELLQELSVSYYFDETREVLAIQEKIRDLFRQARS